MRRRHPVQNLWTSRIVDAIPALGSGGNKLDEFEILVSQPPVGSNGRVIVDFNIPEKRDLIFYHERIGNTLKYYRMNRDLLGTGALNELHSANAIIQMNDMSEWMNYISSHIDDFGQVVSRGNGNNVIKVYGGKIAFNQSVSAPVDAILTLTNGVREVVFDYVDASFKQIDTANLGTLKGLHLATINVNAGNIVSIVDVRATSQTNVFSSGYFTEQNGELILADTGVVPGTYGNGANVPVLQIDAKGRVTSATTIPVGNLPSLNLNYTHTQAAPASTWNIAHNLDSVDVVVGVFDATNNEIAYDSFVIVDADNVTLTFTAPVSGKAVLLIAGGTPAGGMVDPMTTIGDIIFRNSSNITARLPIGTNGQVLTVNAGVPSWQTPSSGFADPMTTAGDMIRRSGSNVTERLAAGVNGQVLTMVTGLPTWSNPVGGGQATYDAIVDASGAGDYLLVSAAITGGAKRIFVRGGVYNEPTAVTIPAGGCVHGESRESVTVNMDGAWTLGAYVVVSGVNFASGTTSSSIAVTGAGSVLTDCNFTSTSTGGAINTGNSTAAPMVSFCNINAGRTALDAINVTVGGGNAIIRDNNITLQAGVFGINNGRFIVNNSITALGPGAFQDIVSVSNTADRTVVMGNRIVNSGTPGNGTALSIGGYTVADSNYISGFAIGAVIFNATDGAAPSFINNHVLNCTTGAQDDTSSGLNRGIPKIFGNTFRGGNVGYHNEWFSANVSDNMFSGQSVAGMSIGPTGALTRTDYKITNNRFRNMGAVPCILTNSTSFGPSECIISDNIIEDSCTVMFSGALGSNSVIANNVARTAAISITNSQAWINITGNDILGITFALNVIQSTISGNIIYGNITLRTVNSSIVGNKFESLVTVSTSPSAATSAITGNHFGSGLTLSAGADNCTVTGNVIRGGFTNSASGTVTAGNA